MSEEDKIKIFMAFTDEVRAINPYFDCDEAKIQIGGGFALYLYGETDSFGDVDFVVDSAYIDNFSDLPFEKVPLRHSKRLNKSFVYRVNGLKIDFIERISDYVPGRMMFNGIKIETSLQIKKAKKKIAKFLLEHYPEDAVKYLK